MALTRVLIENFRSIERCELKPGALTALVGENNAGKTNILRAIETVLGSDWVTKNSFSDEDFRNRDRELDILIEMEFDPPLTYRPFKASDEVQVPTLRYKVSHYKVNSKHGNKGERRLESGCFSRDGKPVFVPMEAPKKGVKTQFKPLTSIPEEVRDQVGIICIWSNRRLADQMPAARNSLLRRLFADIHEALKTATVKDGDGKTERPALDAFAERLRQAFDVLRIPEFNRLEETLRARSLENLGYDPKRDAERLKFHFDLFDPMDFFRAIKLLVREGGVDIDATEMGDGVQNALVLAIFQAFEEYRKKGAIFLVEEPEMYLHPHRQRFLYQLLRKVAVRNQVIYTTHSANFVTLPDFENVQVVRRDQASGGTIVTPSSLKSTAQLREKLIKEFDPERNELFFARHVLLVEGDTEKLALPEYAAKIGADLNRSGCSVIEVGGKKALKQFAQIVSSFGIPLTIVFDRDASKGTFKDKKEEESFNAELHAMKSPSVRVIEHAPDFEGVFRTEIGEDAYLKHCQKYPDTSKAVKQRLIAADPSVETPNFIKVILEPFMPLVEPKASATEKTVSPVVNPPAKPADA